MSFNPFDIAEQQYKTSKQPVPDPTSEQVSQEVNTAPNDFASAYSPFDVAQKMQETGDEGWWDATVRNVTRTGSRMVETVLGLPGDIVQFAKWAEEKLPKPPKWLQQEPNFIQRWGRSALEQLPTQQSLQGHSERLTGGYTAPQGSGEEFSDEVFKTVSSLLTGGGGKTVAQGATNLPRWGQHIARIGRTLGMSVAAESAKEGVKLYGGGEGQQEIAKLGSLFLLGLTLPRLTGEVSPENYITSIYKERDALIPQGTMVTPTGLEHNLQNFINKTLKYGGPTPEKTQVANIAEKFLDKISGKGVEMEELLQMYRDINRNRSAVMAATDLDKAGVRTARKYWGDMANMFNESIEGFLGPINPKALDLHRSANSAFASLSQSKRASNFIMDKIRGVPLKTGVATLFGGGIFYPAVAAKPLGGAAIGASALKGGEMAYRFLTNPTLRHYYNQVMMNAIRENGPETIKAIKQLDKYYQKELNDPKSSVNRPMLPFLKQKQNSQVQQNPNIQDKTLQTFSY